MYTCSSGHGEVTVPVEDHQLTTELEVMMAIALAAALAHK